MCSGQALILPIIALCQGLHPLAQAGVVLSPVRHPVPLLGDAMSTGGIGLEGHGEDLYSEANQAVTLPSRGYQLAHPCNKAL
jgi:hypothetical protein